MVEKLFSLQIYKVKSSKLGDFFSTNDYTNDQSVVLWFCFPHNTKKFVVYFALNNPCITHDDFFAKRLYNDDRQREN